MRNFKFRGFIPAVTKYVKSKPLHLVVIEVIAFGVFIPMITLGIINILIYVATNGAPNINLI